MSGDRPRIGGVCHSKSPFQNREADCQFQINGKRPWLSGKAGAANSRLGARGLDSSREPQLDSYRERWFLRANRRGATAYSGKVTVTHAITAIATSAAARQGPRCGLCGGCRSIHLALTCFRAAILSRKLAIFSNASWRSGPGGSSRAVAASLAASFSSSCI
jgi:hypothetical protein